MLKRYFYTGYFKDGRKKFGFKKGKDKKEIRNILKRENIFPENIYKLSFSKEKPKAEDIINLFTEFKMFVKNGYSFFKILEIAEEIPNLKIYIEKMRESLKQGKSVYEMFKNSGITLSNTEFMIIKSGEESGNLYKTFETLEERIREREKTKKEIKKIMIYPAVVIFTVIFTMLFLGLFILPNFIKIIETSERALPLITKIIIWFAENFLYILFILTTLFFTAVFMLKKQNSREKLFQKFLKIPAVKELFNKIFISNFTETLAVLVDSGITIIESINLIKSEMKYKYFSEKLENAERDLKKGNTLYFAFKNMKIFSRTDIELLKAGEEAGELVEVLLLISERAKENLKQKKETGIKLLEPCLIIIIGIIIGFVFLGIYIPVFQMMDGI